MNAIILAAGRGERLLPHTLTKPKCMVKLFGKTLLEHQLSIFKKCGIKNICVVTGHKSESIKYNNINYIKNYNFMKTNMVESLFSAVDKFTGSTIISYGDIIFEEKILQKLIDSTHEFSIIVDKQWEKYWKMRFNNPLDDLESLKLDDEQNIISIGEQINSLNEIQGQYIGLMKFQNTAISKIKSFYTKSRSIYQNTHVNPLNSKLPFENSYMTDFLQGLINDGEKLKAITIENGWLELDTINDYNLYIKKNLEKTLFKLYDPYD
jgi:L-glutamine-phosphate cytidylyltransferase